jgi:hypothetical protein
MPNIEMPQKAVMYTEWLQKQVKEAVSQAKYEADQHKDDEGLQCRADTLEKMSASFDKSGGFINFYDHKEFLRILFTPYIQEV